MGDQLYWHFTSGLMIANSYTQATSSKLRHDEKISNPKKVHSSTPLLRCACVTEKERGHQKEKREKGQVLLWLLLFDLKANLSIFNGDLKASCDQEICYSLPPGKFLPPMPSQIILIRPKTTFRRLEHWTV